MNEQQLIDEIVWQKMELSLVTVKVKIQEAMISVQKELREELTAIISRLLVGVDERWKAFPENAELMTKVHEALDAKS